MDANGDGIGDFAGLTDGSTTSRSSVSTASGSWPMYPSPLRDDGYGHRGLLRHPSVVRKVPGLPEVSRRGPRARLRVIADLVMNHTSDQHPWFQASRSGPASPYADYYVWNPTDRRFQRA